MMRRLVCRRRSSRRRLPVCLASASQVPRSSLPYGLLASERMLRRSLLFGGLRFYGGPASAGLPSASSSWSSSSSAPAARPSSAQYSAWSSGAASAPPFFAMFSVLVSARLKLFCLRRRTSDYRASAPAVLHLR